MVLSLWLRCCWYCFSDLVVVVLFVSLFLFLLVIFDVCIVVVSLL